MGTPDVPGRRGLAGELRLLTPQGAVAGELRRADSGWDAARIFASYFCRSLPEIIERLIRPAEQFQAMAQRGQSIACKLDGRRARRFCTVGFLVR